MAKEKHHAFFGTPYGAVIQRKLVFDNSMEGFEKLLETVRIHTKPKGLEIPVFGLEATANYHKPLGEFLIRRGFQVVLVSGVAVRRNRELLDGRWDKNDTKDAANVADLVSQGKVLFYDYPSPAVREIQSLVSLKIKLKKMETGLLVRIRNHILAMYFPELDRFCQRGPDLSLAVIRRMLDPKRIAEMDFADFCMETIGRYPKPNQQLRLAAILNAARNSVGCGFTEAAGFEAAMLVESLLDTRGQVKRTEKMIRKTAKQLPHYEYLMSIPGFGPDITSRVIAAIGDPWRFDNYRQVLKLAGLDLNASRSGKTSGGAKPVLSKRGKSNLRYALYQAALIASTRNPPFMEWMAEKIQGREKERGIKTKMRVKLAAKMLVIAWTLMKNQEPFDPKYLNI